MRALLTPQIRKQAWLNAYWIPLNFQQVALLTIAVPAALLRFHVTNYVVAFAELSTTAAIIAMIVPPIFGGISDWFWRRGVPRRYTIYAGAIVNTLGLLYMVVSHSTLTLGIGFVVSTFGHQLSISAYQALMPEVVPREHWGLSAGARGAAALVGTAIALAVSSQVSPAMVFLVAAVLNTAGVFSVLPIREKDGRKSAEVREAEQDKAQVSDWHDFIVVFIARSFTLLGMSLLMTYVLYFFKDVLHQSHPSTGTALVAGLSLVGAIVSSVLSGKLSDRVTRKGLVALAAIPMALCTLIFALVPNILVVIPFAVLFGLGFGAFLSTDWAMGIDAVPKLRDVARDLGLWGIAAGLPAVVAPAFGGWVLTIFGNRLAGYRVLFVIASISFAIGALVVLKVRDDARSHHKQ